VLLHFGVLGCLVISHAPFARRLFARLSHSEMPSTREFVIVSFLVYYDAGFLLESLGFEYVNAFYPSVFNAPDGALALSILILVAAPWLIDLTAGGDLFNSTPTVPPDTSTVVPHLRSKRRLGFYVLTSAICIASVGITVHIAASAPQNIWMTRALVGETLGPFVIVLLLPLYILAFYVRQRDSHSLFGRIYLGFLLLCAIVAPLPAGERSLVLLPVLVIIVFWKRISFRKITTAGIATALAAALLLPFFKLQESATSSASDLIQSVFNNDFARAPILADVVAHSKLVGTRVMKYPGEGYLYSAFYYVPRSLAPFKGYSTQITYTAFTMGTAPDDTHWGIGISAIDELLLNFGVLFLPVGLCLYGLAIRQADRTCVRIPALVVPARLAAVFFLGYHLPALLQNFGGMVIMAILLQRFFGCIGASVITEQSTLSTQPTLAA
jgi:hypothetical protein